MSTTTPLSLAGKSALVTGRPAASVPSQRMFAEIWATRLDEGRAKLRSTDATAFLSTRYAPLLALGL